MASFNPFLLPGSMIKPFTPSFTISGIPPTFVEIIGNDKTLILKLIWEVLHNKKVRYKHLLRLATLFFFS